jgi:hypothetical protein
MKGDALYTVIVPPCTSSSTRFSASSNPCLTAILCLSLLHNGCHQGHQWPDPTVMYWVVVCQGRLANAACPGSAAFICPLCLALRWSMVLCQTWQFCCVQLQVVLSIGGMDERVMVKRQAEAAHRHWMVRGSRGGGCGHSMITGGHSIITGRGRLVATR